MKRAAALALLLAALACGQVDLQFAQGRAGQVPPGWFVLDATHRGFTADWRREGCHATPACAVLSAPPNAPAEAFGTLMQSFAALPFRGQTVRLRVWVRLEKKAPTDRAQMLLHVERPNFQQGFADNMANRPIVTEEWGEYEIRGEVATDAQTIQIGLSVYGSGRAWIDGVEFSAVTAETAGPAVDAAREAIGKQYARMDAAFLRGDVKEIATVLMPGAQMGVGTIREPLLPAIQGEIDKGEKLTTRTEIAALRLDGDDAIVMVRREAQDPKSEGTGRVVTSHRDTWTDTPDGWRWRESIEVSYHWVLPPTSAEAARPVIEELKTRAVPVAGEEGLAAFGAAVGDARIVALGEAAHGTREFRELKERLVEYLAAHKGFTVLAGAPDEALALAERLHIEFDPSKPPAAAISQHPQSKIVLWTDNTTVRDPQLREKFGSRLYAVGFAFDRGEVRAVGVEEGESKGLGTYTAAASPEGSGDAVLRGAGLPQFFLNIARLPAGGPLARWLGRMHLFHDIGAYWVLDDSDAALQPMELGVSYDGLYYVEEVHSGG